MADGPRQEWWSAAELADAGLPDMPGSKRKVNDMAARQNWRGRPGKARRRKAVGGGFICFFVCYFPENRSTPLWTDDRIPRKLQHGNSICNP